jgi:hypothetical protein
MKSPLLALGILIIVSVGCTRNNIFRVDPSFTKEEKQAIFDAVTEWCTATNGHACMHLAPMSSDFSQNMIRKVSAEEMSAFVSSHGGGNGESKDGAYYPAHFNVDATLARPSTELNEGIFLVPQVDPSTFKAKILHELGHWAIGTHGHMPSESGTVMAPKAESSIITDADVELYCDSNGCEIQDHKASW